MPPLSNKKIPCVLRCLSALVLVLVLWELPSSLRFMQNVTISQGVYEELSSLKNAVAEPENTLVVARHGLEYWAG